MTVKKGPITLIGIALRTDNAKAPVEIAKHWERFLSQNILSQIPNKKSTDVYGLYTDYESDHTGPFTLLIGCEVSPGTAPPPGLVLKQVPAATYTRIPVAGPHPQGIVAAWQKVWQSPIPRAFTSDFELYGTDFQTKQTLDLYIAVKDREKCACHCR